MGISKIDSPVVDTIGWASGITSSFTATRGRPMAIGWIRSVSCDATNPISDQRIFTSARKVDTISLALMALTNKVIESRSSVVNSVSPRATAFARAALISWRMRSWYSGWRASSYSTNDSDAAVVSWPAMVRDAISAMSSSLSKRVLASADEFALTGNTSSSETPYPDENSGVGGVVA